MIYVTSMGDHPVVTPFVNAAPLATVMVSAPLTFTSIFPT